MLAMVKDSDLQDEVALSPLETAVAMAGMAKRRHDAARDAAAAAESSNQEARTAIREAVLCLARALAGGEYWCGNALQSTWPVGSIEQAVAYMGEMETAANAEAARLEAKAASLPDARTLRRIHAAAKSLRYHAQRVKEGK